MLELRALFAMLRAGILRPMAPARALTALRALRNFGPLGGMLTAAALQHGDRDAVIDDRGRTSFAELEAQSNAAAHGLRARGLGDGAVVAILCRNHAGALMAVFAAAKAGSRVVFLNTGSAPPQVREVCARESVKGILLDDDLQGLAAELPSDIARVACRREGEMPLHELQHGELRTLPSAPACLGSIVLLTSGTTGTPKGAPQQQTRFLVVAGGLLDRLPFRARQTTVTALPLFHGTGFALTTLNIALGCTLVMRPRFDPEQCLADLSDERATGLLVVPVMLQRMLALGDERIRAEGPLDLRVVFCTGSQLPAPLATHAMDLLGDVLYNLYGSTEVSVATIATPADLRAAPGSVGRPVLGARVRILSSDGEALPPGITGRIFVGTTSPFEEYTGGGSKEQIDGLRSTGDVGHVSGDGLLFIDGRDDEMIVSGAENVFPREVEDLLIAHPQIDDAAAVGVEDQDFGQRLAVFVVRSPGATLDEQDVREHVKANLARYKVPRDVVFIGELPRNPTGKILNRELLRRLST